MRVRTCISRLETQKLPYEGLSTKLKYCKKLKNKAPLTLTEKILFSHLDDAHINQVCKYIHRIFGTESSGTPVENFVFLNSNSRWKSKKQLSNRRYFNVWGGTSCSRGILHSSSSWSISDARCFWYFFIKFFKKWFTIKKQKQPNNNVV